MKAINDLLKKQRALEIEVASLSNGKARVAQKGGRIGDIEIWVQGIAQGDVDELVRSINKKVAQFIEVTLHVKNQELSEVNHIIEEVENLLESKS